MACHYVQRVSFARSPADHEVSDASMDSHYVLFGDELDCTFILTRHISSSLECRLKRVELTSGMAKVGATATAIENWKVGDRRPQEALVETLQ